MWAGCYVLDLYCVFMTGDFNDPPHEHREFPHQFTAEHGSQCRRQARKRGWIFCRDGEVICPKCRNRKREDSDNG